MVEAGNKIPLIQKIPPQRWISVITSQLDAKIFRVNVHKTSDSIVFKLQSVQSFENMTPTYRKLLEQRVRNLRVKI